jgi:hypothetical protein
MLKVGPKLFTIAISLSVMSFSPSTIAATCGPGDHWVDTCPSGIDEPLYHWANMKLDLGGGEIDINLSGGTFRIYRGEAEDGPVMITPPSIPTIPPTPSSDPPENVGVADSHNDVIRTEIISLIFEGDTPLGHVTIRAGDGNGNLGNDGPLHSPGVIYESPTDPAEACSFFFVTYEMEINGVADLIYGQARMARCNVKRLDPINGKITDEPYKDPRQRPIYDSQGNIIGYVYHEHPLKVEIASFDATLTDGRVSLSWASALETEHAGFVVVRGQPKTVGVCTDNPADYTNIVTLAWVSPNQPYSLEDPTGDDTQCYGLLDVGFDGQWGLHVTSVK